MINVQHRTEGLLFINKPENITSFDCIRRMKRLMPRKTKIGHTGTLDDFASGLLIICIGRTATKLVPLLMDCDKEYVVRAKLGQLTDSLDLTGKTVDEKECLVTRDEIEKAMKALQPSYTQIPPIFSALKHQGKPLYHLVRYKKMTQEAATDIAQAKSRVVQIKEVELTELEDSYFTFRALVSKGTYVRSLAHDIALQCGTWATTYKLHRTKIGDIDISQAVDLDALVDNDAVEKHLLSVAEFKKLLKI